MFHKVSFINETKFYQNDTATCSHHESVLDCFGYDKKTNICISKRSKRESVLRSILYLLYTYDIHIYFKKYVYVYGRV